MNSAIELIEIIRKRPGMYIGENSILCLKSFIDGWSFKNIEDITKDIFLEQFQNWIENKYKIFGGQPWSKIILFYSQDERDALDAFFKDFDDFKIYINSSKFLCL